MNIPQNVNKIQKRNSSPAPFNIKIPSFNSIQNNNNNNNNTSLLNQKNIDYSYSNTSQSDEINEPICPNCLSYQRNLKEKNILIQKLQNQLNRINTTKMNLNNQINAFKKTIANLKNELENKIEEITILKLNYDEKLADLKNDNRLLNRETLKFQKLVKYKDNEIKQYKEKVQVLIMKINSKNNDINKIKGQSNDIVDNSNNNYYNLLNNYNTLAFASGGKNLIKYSHSKSKTNIGSDISSYEEDHIADLLMKAEKTTNLSKSKSQKIKYESENETRINKKISKDRIKTPKMSSTQSSWMIPPAKREIILNRNNNELNNNYLNDNYANKMNTKLIMTNEKLNEENISLKNDLEKFQINYQNMKKLLYKKNNEIIKYQKECKDKNNQIEKLKSIEKTYSSKKIPYYSSTASNKSKNNTINNDNYPKLKDFANEIKDFNEYKQENNNKISKNKTSTKDFAKNLIDDSDEDNNNEKYELKSNKSSSNLKKNILINEDVKIKMLNSKLKEKMLT